MTSDDPAVPAAALKQAMKAGIKVITFDSDVPSARDFFIQDTAYNTIAEGVINAAVKAEGPERRVRHHVVDPDATIQLAWISAMQAYIKAKYPKIKWRRSATASRPGDLAARRPRRSSTPTRT